MHPAPPKVTTTVPTPLEISTREDRTGSVSPPSASASVWLTTSTSISDQRSAGKGDAGAAFRTTRTPATLAARQASAIVSTGTSNWTRSTDAAPIVPSCFLISDFETRPFAPGKIRIRFSPEASSQMDAFPVGASWSMATASTEIPASAKASIICAPNASEPTFPTIETLAPARAAANAWLAPFPPR